MSRYPSFDCIQNYSLLINRMICYILYVLFKCVHLNAKLPCRSLQDHNLAMRVVFFTYVLILAEFDREPAVQAERTRIPLCLFLFGKAIVPDLERT